MVEFDEEQALILAELHLPVDQGDGFAATEEKVLAMGVAVGGFVRGHIDGADGKVVVLVVAVAGADALEESSQIAQEEGFVFVDFDGGGGVAGIDDDEAVADAGLVDAVGNPVGDVDEVRGRAGFQLDTEGFGFHPVTFPHSRLAGLGPAGWQSAASRRSGGGSGPGPAGASSCGTSSS